MFLFPTFSVLCGLSMGGAICMNSVRSLQLRKLRIKQLVLIAPAGFENPSFFSPVCLLLAIRLASPKLFFICISQLPVVMAIARTLQLHRLISFICAIGALFHAKFSHWRRALMVNIFYGYLFRIYIK